MYSIFNFFVSNRLATFLFMVAFSVVCAFSANEVKADEGPGFCKVLTANNYCYMTRAYIPKDELNAKLPARVSIPSDAEMKEYFPDTPLKDDAHPIMISVCRGTELADVYIGNLLPEQEETMILVPVIYSYPWPFNWIKHMAAFVPVLYLDTEEGVAGGDFYGLRKEYHPEITTEVTNTTKISDMAGNEQWPDDLYVEYEQTGENLDGLDNFFEQLFLMAYSSLSYNNRYKFMRVGVFPREVRKANEFVEWTWDGTSITDSYDMMSQFADYFYTASWPMTAHRAFYKTSSPGEEEVKNPGCPLPFCK